MTTRRIRIAPLLVTLAGAAGFVALLTLAGWWPDRAAALRWLALFWLVGCAALRFVLAFRP